MLHQKKTKLIYGRLIADEILLADYKLVEMSRKKMIIAGSTALIAVIDSTRLIVANVGDSRGVINFKVTFDYPLKPKLVIANPDILEFELSTHRPQFLILASDGLWDTFSNEEAVLLLNQDFMNRILVQKV
ncbi:hypothetical protein PVAND_016252 [Polypedilum vanderplanki]|uniref:PPM-type phosphatase domain-containing protein n=1 Tax=Polypedilum vanderplanki TaxID=319348 RepID=A0A9J6BF14_POLVA|nr:hypothetical protein PVAND_016252 [Polypedilum vanderplanki]